MATLLDLAPHFAAGALSVTAFCLALRWIGEVVDLAGRPLSPGDDL